jgi:hypothetical protein
MTCPLARFGPEGDRGASGGAGDKLAHLGLVVRGGDQRAEAAWELAGRDPVGDPLRVVAEV